MSEGRIVTLSQKAAAVTLMCFSRTNVKKGMTRLKGRLDEKLDAFRASKVISWKSNEDGTIEPAQVVPETGPGWEDFRIVGNVITLTKAEAEHLQESFEEIINKDGFPAAWARGVLEVEDILNGCIAEVKEPK